VISLLSPISNYLILQDKYTGRTPKTQAKTYDFFNKNSMLTNLKYLEDNS